MSKHGGCLTCEHCSRPAVEAVCVPWTDAQGSSGAEWELCCALHNASAETGWLRVRL